MTPGLRRLYIPDSATVEVDRGGAPRAVDGVAVQTVREEWRVEDRWWTPKPLRRRYFDLSLADGHLVAVFSCEASGRWYRQRA